MTKQRKFWKIAWRKRWFSGRRGVAVSGMAGMASLLAGTLALAGCSSNANKVGVGPIAFTDALGNPQTSPSTTISVGSTRYVDVTLGDDASSLGVDWTVACGSAPAPGTPLPPGVVVDASCGTFTPVHTSSAPVPQLAASGAGVVTLYTAPAIPPKEGVVTLYAAATADHSRYSSATLTILGLPISITLAPAPPVSVETGSSIPIKAVLTNDYVAGGATWTVACGSSDCGSFKPATTASGVATVYTAPATVPADTGSGPVVTVTATSVTDSTKSVSATIAIQAPAK